MGLGLRQAIVQLQSNSDEHVVIGQLHHELISARLQIRTLNRNQEEDADRIERLIIDLIQFSLI